MPKKKKKNMEAKKTLLPRHTKMLRCLIVSSVILYIFTLKSDSPIILRSREQTAAHNK